MTITPFLRWDEKGHIEKLGINSTQHFIETTSTITFKQQGEMWLRSLANRKRNPIEQFTIDNRRYALDKWIYPFVGEIYLADVNNFTLKQLVDHMSALSPSSIRDYKNIVKAVVDQNRAFRLDWAEKIGLGFELPGNYLGNLGYRDNSEKLPKLLKEIVDGRGFEPPASSLRTMR